MRRPWRSHRGRLWRGYGEAMERLWRGYGEAMERPWRQASLWPLRTLPPWPVSMASLYGLSMPSPRPLYGLSMVSLCLCMASLWPLYGLSMARLHGLSMAMERLWRGYGHGAGHGEAMYRPMEAGHGEAGEAMEAIERPWGGHRDAIGRPYKSHREAIERP
jgi:hypothetical protein